MRLHKGDRHTGREGDVRSLRKLLESTWREVPVPLGPVPRFFVEGKIIVDVNFGVSWQVLSTTTTQRRKPRDRVVDYDPSR